MKLKRQHILLCTLIVSILASGCKVDEKASQTIADYTDETAPTVASCTVEDGGTLSVSESSIQFVFSEEMNSTTINDQTITLSDASSDIGGAVSYTGKTATFTFGSTLSSDTSYTIVLSDSILDLGGNSLSGDRSISFETRAASALPDTGQTTSYTSTFGEDSDYTINPPSYTDNGDGTVTDNVTNLVWQQSDDNTTRTWTSAGTYCDDLSLGSQSDWRLPNVNELVSILNLGTTYSPSINSVFSGTNSSRYWSSTTSAGNTSHAWRVDFGNGSVYYNYKSYGYYVRCVRGGQ